jgi:hypothetical protein
MVTKKGIVKDFIKHALKVIVKNDKMGLPIRNMEGMLKKVAEKALNVI